MLHNYTDTARNCRDTRHPHPGGPANLEELVVNDGRTASLPGKAGRGGRGAGEGFERIGGRVREWGPVFCVGRRSFVLVCGYPFGKRTCGASPSRFLRLAHS